MHTSNVFTSVWHQLLSFIATLSGGTSCKFMQLLEFQISVSCIDTGYKQEGLQRELKLTHRFCHVVKQKSLKGLYFFTAIFP